MLSHKIYSNVNFFFLLSETFLFSYQKDLLRKLRQKKNDQHFQILFDNQKSLSRKIEFLKSNLVMYSQKASNAKTQLNLPILVIHF